MKKNILFLHPDLGIGGAERLVVDAALALINKGHQVSFVTTHHDLSHCFAETKDGSFAVTVVGNWIPRHFLGRFFALFAYIRMLYAALYIVFFSQLNPDVIFCDIVSVCIPVLRLKTHVIYYCHFPDQLLSKRGSMLKDLYRAPLNWLEEKTTAAADLILVNSQFTRKVFQNTFKSISIMPDVLYPSINTGFFNQSSSTTLQDLLGFELPLNKFIFLSINRYERKKNIDLAIEALSSLKTKVSDEIWQRVFLIIAGGFDNRVLENVEHYEELIEKSKTYHVVDKICFLKSPSDMEKLCLLSNCNCLLYTPSNEHFGIVPLEAMYSKKPVIAVNSGGPTETVVNGETGFLCHPNKDDFSTAMEKLLNDPFLTKTMGEAGRRRFEEKFSFDVFQDQLSNVVENLTLPDKND